MIEVKNLSFSYEDILALDNINFSMGNEKVVLLGSNGSGKSTLLRILAGLYFAKGEYFFDGIKITKKSVNKEFRKKIGILFQNPDSMIFNPSVFDEIAFSLREFGFSDVEDRVIEIAKKFNIIKLLKKSQAMLQTKQDKVQEKLMHVISQSVSLSIILEGDSPKTQDALVEFEVLQVMLKDSRKKAKELLDKQIPNCKNKQHTHQCQMG